MQNIYFIELYLFKFFKRVFGKLIQTIHRCVFLEDIFGGVRNIYMAIAMLKTV